MTKPVILAALLLTAGCAPHGAQVRVESNGPAPAQRYVEVEVPVAPPRIIIEGEPYRARRRDGPPLILRLPIAPDGSDERPADVKALVRLLWTAMPPDYRRALAAHFGYSIHGRPGAPSRHLRGNDVANFTIDRYDLYNTSTPLGKQFACISWSESEFSSIFVLIARQERWSNNNYRRRADIPEDLGLFYEAAIADRLVNICGGDADRPQG